MENTLICFFVRNLGRAKCQNFHTVLYNVRWLQFLITILGVGAEDQEIPRVLRESESMQENTSI